MGQGEAMSHHAFVVRLVLGDEGDVKGRLSEPATGWSAGFMSLADLARLLESWTDQQVAARAARPAVEQKGAADELDET
jgi:hypothetical protein